VTIDENPDAEGGTTIRGPFGPMDGISEEARAWSDEINAVATQQAVPADILLSLVQQESAGDPNVIGSDGEHGLTQLKPIAVRDVAQNTQLDFIDPAEMTPRQQLRYGAAFLRLQRRRVDSDPDLAGWADALRAYNAGFQGAKTNAGRAQQYAQSVLRRTGRISYA
jgi:soluble lytic murein transglycosylase-like protein